MAWESPSKNELQIGVVCEDGNPTALMFLWLVFTRSGFQFLRGEMCEHLSRKASVSVFFPQGLMAGFPENSGGSSKFGEVHLLGLQGLRTSLGGGFKYFLFSPLLGEDSHFDQYFSDGLKPPTRSGSMLNFRGLKFKSLEMPKKGDLPKKASEKVFFTSLMVSPVKSPP